MPRGCPYPKLAPKLLDTSVNEALPASCIWPFACEGSPKQDWAAAGALATAIRAMETTSMRRIRVSVKRVWVHPARSRSIVNAAPGAATANSLEQGSETETPIPVGIGRSGEQNARLRQLDHPWREPPSGLLALRPRLTTGLPLSTPPSGATLTR